MLASSTISWYWQAELGTGIGFQYLLLILVNNIGRWYWQPIYPPVLACHYWPAVLAFIIGLPIVCYTKTSFTGFSVHFYNALYWFIYFIFVIFSTKWLHFL